MLILTYAKVLVSKHDTAFQNPLNWNAKTSRDVTHSEHNTFLMYFLNKYFYNTNSFPVIKELHPFILMLLSNKCYSWELSENTKSPKSFKDALMKVLGDDNIEACWAISYQRISGINQIKKKSNKL